MALMNKSMDSGDEFAKLPADLEALDDRTGSINADTGGDDAGNQPRRWR